MKLRSLFLTSGLAFTLSIAPAHAEFHLFRIAEVYSNADGSVQYIVLRESTGSNNENFLAGQMVRATNAAGIAQNFAFPSNLPSSNTASRSVLIATPGFAALGLIAPDYTIPARFIPTEGGSLNYLGAFPPDPISLPPLPNDGVTAVDRNGTPVPATPKNFANTTAAVTATPIAAVEFYNSALDHYFISSLAGDIDALDSGRLAGWVRTGLSFNVYPSQAAGGAGVTAVCRIRIPPPSDSHFFGRSPQECADTLAKFPFMEQETPTAFFIALPAAGVCPAGTVPVYRAFDNRPDANHRYTTDRAVRDHMAAISWTIEGDGPDFVVMCATMTPAPTALQTTDGSTGGMPMPMPMPPGYGGGYGSP